MLKPVISNASPMNGPAQIDAVADFAEQGWQLRSGTGSARGALTTDDIHPGLVWKDTDGLRGLYGRNAANNGWDTLYLPSLKRMHLLDINTASIGTDGASLGTISFGSFPVARRVLLNFSGELGFSANGNFSAGVKLAPTNCTIVRAGAAFDDATRVVEAGSWYAYSLTRILDIAAGATASVQVQSVFTPGDHNCYYRMTAVGSVYLPGEY